MMKTRSRDIGVAYFHCAQPYLKSEFARCWETYQDVIRATAGHRFRAPEDVNHYLVRFHTLVRGNFVPSRRRKYLDILLSNDLESVRRGFDSLLTTAFTIGCINDGHDISDENLQTIRTLQEACLDLKFPTKSSFER